MVLDRRPTLTLDWGFVLRNAGWGFAILACAGTLVIYAVVAVMRPDRLFQDAELYHQATAAWLAGGNPWMVSHNGIVFAGIPPTLLLNLPLQPFPSWVALIVWPVAGAAGMILVIRRLGLSPLWLLWPPVIEGWTAGSPDYALLGLAILGGGAVAVVTKPYTIPALFAMGRWRAVIVGGAIGLASLPILPWGMFFAERDRITATLVGQAGNLSAWGSPVLMIATIVSLALLRRDGLELATPGLWPSSQMHYALFSIRAAAKSPILALGLAVPIAGAAAVAIVAYATLVYVSRSNVSQRIVSATIASYTIRARSASVRFTNWLRVS